MRKNAENCKKVPLSNPLRKHHFETPKNGRYEPKRDFLAKSRYFLLIIYKKRNCGENAQRNFLCNGTFNKNFTKSVWQFYVLTIFNYFVGEL